MSEQNNAVDSSVHYNIPEIQSTPGQSKPHPHPPSLQPNGQHCPPQPSHQEISTEESEEEDEEEGTEEDEPTTSRWQGIEAIFEAYQEYAEGKMCVQQIGSLSVLLHDGYHSSGQQKSSSTNPCGVLVYVMPGVS